MLFLAMSPGLFKREATVLEVTRTLGLSIKLTGLLPLVTPMALRPLASRVTV